jgi:tight adherence protein C
VFSLLIPILAALSVYLLGGAVIMARHTRRTKLEIRLAAGALASAHQPRSATLVTFLSRVGTAVSAGKSSRTLGEELARAGYHAPNAAPIFLGAKMSLFALGAIASYFLGRMFTLPGLQGILLTGLAAATLFFLPNVFVSARRRQRRQEVTYHLPDAIDLLEITVSAGMGIDQAWNSVTDEIRRVCPILSDEMALTNLEIQLGATRTTALRHMADRTGAAELSSLVACLLQAERFGTSIRVTLRNFAANLREVRSQRAQEAAEKMAVKLLFPMVLFIFPPALLIMAGPAFLSLHKSLGGSH